MTPVPTPGRPLGRPGVLLLALLLTGCEAGGNETVLLDSAEVAVPGRVHEVRLGGAGARDSLAPARVEAEPGDIVRFTVADRRPHAVVFLPGSTGPVRDFLRRTGQLRGPPLVNEGAAWIVTLDEAPPGRYPFRCRVHDADGILVVTAAD